MNRKKRSKIAFQGNFRVNMVKGCGMGPWWVLVSPCFRENVVATCKIWSFLCSLDNLLKKNVIVFLFLEIKFQSGAYLKRAIFDLLFTFFSHQGKVTKILSARISFTYIHVFCSPYWLFCLTNFEKNTNLWYGFSLVWFLVLILIHAILEQSINNKMVSKIQVECYYWYVLTLMPNLQSFVNLGLWMTEVKTQLNTEISKSTAS